MTTTSSFVFTPLLIWVTAGLSIEVYLLVTSSVAVIVIVMRLGSGVVCHLWSTKSWLALGLRLLVRWWVKVVWRATHLLLLLRRLLVWTLHMLVRWTSTRVSVRLATPSSRPTPTVWLTTTCIGVLVVCGRGLRLLNVCMALVRSMRGLTPGQICMLNTNATVFWFVQICLRLVLIAFWLWSPTWISFFYGLEAFALIVSSRLH